MDLTSFYKNKNIFITGCTGNIGKALVGKLLKSFPEIGTLYLLVRSKEGNSAIQRSEEYFKDAALLHLQNVKTQFKKKIVWLEGDITKINLGLSEESLQLIRKHVNIIFHSAATVQLSVKLKTGITINVKGTQELLNLAESCNNLDCFMYISTTYTNTRRTVNYIQEIHYEHPVKPQELLELAKYNSMEKLEEESQQFLNNDWLLTYGYTKNAAENLVKQYESKFKIGLFRPGIVVESIFEPFPYCGKDTSVIATVMMMATKGYFLKCDPFIQMNCVPIDFTINAIIAATQDTFKRNIGRSNIYNYSSNNNPISINKAIKYYVDGFQDPTNLPKLPKDIIEQHINNLQCFFNNRSSQIRWGRYEQLNEFLNYFLLNGMYFENKNIENVWNMLNNDDKKNFNFNVNLIDWKSFFKNMYINQFCNETQMIKDEKQVLQIHKNKL